MVESNIDRDNKRSIALSDNKRDRFWDSWMKRSDRNAGIRHGKGDRPFRQ